MPAYNVADFIGQAIQSVLDQTHSNFELLIINDGSKDQTEKIVLSFNDPRITLVSQTNAGVAAALNKGLSLADTDYIARFDADDICVPARLEKQLNFLVEHPDYAVVGSDAEYITAEGSHLFDFKCIGHTHEAIIKKLYFYCPFIHSAVMYRKSLVIKAGAYIENAHHFEDYLLWVRLCDYGKYFNLPEQLIKVRFHPLSVTMDEKWRSRDFRQLKRKSILKREITAKEGGELLHMIQKQNLRKIKEAAYYALCGKKYLFDNYSPKQARIYLYKAIRIHPRRVDNYFLIILSFFPIDFIKWLHFQRPNKI